MLSIDISNSESGKLYWSHTHTELKLPLENKLLLLWKETFLAHTIGFTASTWTNWVWNFSRISDISECMRWSFESSARVVWEVFSLYSSLSVCGVVSHGHHRLEKVVLCCGGGVCCMCGDYLQLDCVIPHGNPVVSSTETHWCLNAASHLNVIKTNEKSPKIFVFEAYIRRVRSSRSSSIFCSKSAVIHIVATVWRNVCRLHIDHSWQTHSCTDTHSLTAYFRLLFAFFSIFAISCSIAKHWIS